ncbi:MAG: DUF5107 domain-containing protein [Chloroflexota bacterium]
MHLLGRCSNLNRRVWTVSVFSLIGIILLGASACITVRSRPQATVEIATMTAVVLKRTNTPLPTPTQTATPSPSIVIFTPTAIETQRSLTDMPITITPTVKPNIWVKSYQTTVTLPTYPFREYLVPRLDPLYNMTVYHLDRPSYEASNPVPTNINYEAVVLENPYLKLTFLPELGGRLYSAIVKHTSQEIFYHNPVVKPSRYGLLQPPEANWWLAMGGMEWAYPTQEHGYRWGIPWVYEVETTADQVSIILIDEAPDQVGARVRVTLAADSGLFTVEPSLTNLTDGPTPIQFWSNAALSLTPGSMSPHTKFIVPVGIVTVHSRGADGWSVPDQKSQISWPRVNGAKLDDYAQWSNYLGFFMPNMNAPFVGAYNPIDDVGVARLIAPGTIAGNKVFAFSLTFPYRDYTDDDSQYFEIWGGLNEGFWPENDQLVQPAQTVGWQERWWPFSGLGGLTWANDRAAIHLTTKGAHIECSVMTPRPTQGRLIVRSGETTLLDIPFMSAPDQTLTESVSFSSGPLQLTLIDETGQIILQHTSDIP